MGYTRLPVGATVEYLMPFPDSPRVIYRTNPLEEVICQLKFPPILKIDSEPPAAFQDHIRGEYPLLKENPGPQLSLPPAIAKMFASDFPAFATNKVYQFVSPDEVWTVGLSREFVALSTNQYSRWEDFRVRLDRLFATLLAEYKPAFLVRVGLRYRDVIKRSKVGKPQAPWTEFLAPHILGELADDAVAPSVVQTTRDTIFTLPEVRGGRVRMIHGLAPSQPPGEMYYSIDSDYYTEERMEVNHVFDALNSFNRQAGRLFRWCITRQLHDALGPSFVD
jgi:uncharacterized protein (TIGR04255 family)